MAERIIISGDPGTRWTNTTEKVQYQFFVSFINTCGVCLQYHMKIGAWWPIPIHFGCRCGQAPIPPQAKAPYEFVDYRELLAQFPPSMQAAAVGASNYKLLKAGVVQWSDVVTPSRVRDLREVVAKKRLSIATMEKAGVGPRWAREAHAAVHTPEHELVAQQRQQLLQRLVGAGISQEQLVGELSARLAERVSIGAGAGIEAQRLKRPGGGDHGGLLAALLSKPKPPKPAPAQPTPVAPPPPIPTPRTATPLPEQLAQAIDEALPKYQPPPIAPPAAMREPQTATPLPEQLAQAIQGAKPSAIKSKTPAKPKEDKFPKIGDELTPVPGVTLGGASGAKLVTDKNGKKYVLKKGMDAGHLRNEAAADELYRAIGLDVPRSKLYETPNGPVKLSQFEQGRTLGELKRTDPAAYERARQELKRGFVADALMANWDFMGNTGENWGANILVTPAGKVLRIDNGGALRYRGIGSLKSSQQWGNVVGELTSLRNPGISAGGGEVYKDITAAEIKAQSQAIWRRRATILKAAPADVREVLAQRIDYLHECIKPTKPVKLGNWKATPAEQFKTWETTEQAHAWAKKTYKEWFDALSDAEKSAINRHQNNSSTINAKLRRPEISEPLTIAEKERVALLDAALAKRPLPESITVIRHFDLADAGLTYEQVKLGSDILDAGFVPTSVNPQHSWSGHRFEIRLPAGTPAGYARMTGSFTGEYELTLPRNVDRFRVVEMKNDAKQTIVLEPVIPKAPKKK